MDPISLAILGYLIRGRLRMAWRALLIALGIRRITPRVGELLPTHLVTVPELPRDTGGGYRPKHRPQDPAKDPREPFGGESSSRGEEHGWSGCTMSAGADALAYATAGALELWGGDLRHEQQDLDGGTDLYDLRTAWEAYGETLTIKSGSGWGPLVDAHEARRPIVIQGSGQVPGAGDFTGGHACSIAPETHSDGRWLFGDPLCTDWQWIEPSKIRSWAEDWQSSIAYAAGPKPDPDEPDPPPPPPPAKTYTQAELDAAVAAADAAARSSEEAECALELTQAGDDLVGEWMEWMRAPRPRDVDRWDAGAWADPGADLEELIDEGVDPDPCEPGSGAPAAWNRGGLPSPVSDAIAAVYLPAAWDGSSWRAAAWRS